MTNGEFQACTERIERLVERVNSLSDADARTTALDLLQALMDLHGSAISRIVGVLADSGEAGRDALAKLGNDPLICELLILYGIHPRPLHERVGRAIENVRPQVQKHGGTLELLALGDASVRVKLQASANGCGSSPEKLKLAVEQAILEAAPEITEIITEGVPSPGFVPLNMIQPALKEENKYEESTA